MRNGNLHNNLHSFHTCFSSYPTYEEWKQELYVDIAEKLLSSYPTYEEWKLANLIPLSKALRVLILPMRNGNIIREIT